MGAVHKVCINAVKIRVSEPIYHVCVTKTGEKSLSLTLKNRVY